MDLNIVRFNVLSGIRLIYSSKILSMNNKIA